MSLLMDALKKAEQAKKQAGSPAGGLSGLQNVPVPPPPARSQPVPDTGLVLEVSEEEAIPQVCESTEVVDCVEEDTPVVVSGMSTEEASPVAQGDIQGNAQTEVVEAGRDTASPEIPDFERPTRQGVEGVSTEVDLPSPAISEDPNTASVAVDQVEPDAIQVQDGQQPQAEHLGIVSAAASRQAARNVFAAKQEFQRRSRNRRLRAMGLVGALAVVGLAGFYIFISRSMLTSVVTAPGIEARPAPQTEEEKTMQSDTTTQTIQSVVPVTEVKTEAIAPQSAAQVQAPAPETAPATQAAAPPPKESLSAPVSPPSSPSEPLPVLSPTVKLSAQEKSPLPTVPISSDSAPSSSEDPEPSASPQNTIVISHRAASPVTNPLLRAAYDAYKGGDYVLARQKYQQALQADPQNRGALLGLAAAAVQGHENGLARELYLRVLDQEPGDPLARAGLLAIAPTEDPVKQESELKLLLEQHPQTAVLFFSLGNLYAAGQRWSEAQDAYFKALQAARNAAAKTGGVHPDYPFNLAVSLERLGQVKPAVKYYREALAQAAGQAAGFDVKGLEIRLQTLDSGVTP